MGPRLSGARVLVVEDEYLLALDAEQMLVDAGAQVVGPAPSCSQALALVNEAAIDAAVVDVNLGGEMAFPVIDALLARGVPVVLTTGYDASLLAARYPDVPRCEKPVEAPRLLSLLAAMAEAG